MTYAQITARHLTVRRGDVAVLDDVSFTANSGEFITVCGTNGVGKSSLLLALAGFIPAEGDLHVRGRIGVVWQSNSTFEWMTVRQQIQFALHDYYRAEEWPDRLETLLARTGLSQLANKYPGELSGGEAQRLGLARAMATDPDILMMDEPFSALDWQRRRALQDWLLDLWAETGKLILFVTHDLEEAIKLGDRVLLIRPHQPLLTIPVTLPRPRSPELVFSNEFNRLKLSISELFYGRPPE